MKPLLTQSLAEHRRALDAGAYSSTDLTNACLEEIERLEPTVGAFLTVDAEGALAAARESDARRASGDCRSALDGIPYGLKDNFCTKGLRTTAASRMLADFVPPYDATVTVRLRQAGAVLMGKLNLDELAMGSSTEHSAMRATKNPIDPARVPGGSSGGSAAAVAAGELPFAIGSDTGGSVRQPAAFCGVLGLKPTYGAISRYGMIAHASSLDCVGLITRCAEDAKTVLDALVGMDGHDATTFDYPRSQHACADELPPLRIAVVRELTDPEVVSPAVSVACNDAIAAFRAHGAVIGEVSLPSPARALASYCVISAAEASSNMGRFDGVHYGYRADAEGLFGLYSDSRAEGFGDEVKRRILFGTHMLSEENRPLYYDTARAAREEIRASLLQTLSEYDLILNPTAPTVAWTAGSVCSAAMQRRADLCTVYASLAGLPALSVSFGTGEDGMPVGIHLTAGYCREALLLQAAKCLEEVRG